MLAITSAFVSERLRNEIVGVANVARYVEYFSRIINGPFSQ